MPEIGLFPLGIALLPTERVPLHVFEPRYRELIGECLEHGSDFGLVYAGDDGMHEVGTRASVVEVVARFADGRLDILVEGGERFRLERLTDGRTFQTGMVALVSDRDDPASTPRSSAHAACSRGSSSWRAQTRRRQTRTPSSRTRSPAGSTSRRSSSRSCWS